MPSKKMGRPPSENPKTKTLRIRVNDNTEKKLEECATEMELNKSEVIRRGIDIMHSSLNKK